MVGLSHRHDLSFSRRRISLLDACVLVRLLRLLGLRIVVLLFFIAIICYFLFPQPLRLRKSNSDSGDVWVRRGCGCGCGCRGRVAAAPVGGCLGSLASTKNAAVDQRVAQGPDLGLFEIANAQANAARIAHVAERSSPIVEVDILTGTRQIRLAQRPDARERKKLRTVTSTP